MGEADAPRVRSTVEFPGQGNAPSGAVSASGPAAAGQGSIAAAAAAADLAGQQAAQQVQPQVAQPTADPLSRPYMMPSRGLYYQQGCQGGQVIIAPTRGAQEEILAGARENPATALPALRHVASQCVNTQGLPFNELLLFDFTAMLFHFLALSAGTDELTLTPTHSGCGKAFQATLTLETLACTVLRKAAPDEQVKWPPYEDEDDPLAVLREMEREEKGGTTELVIPPDAVDEPFITEPLPHTKDTVGWRYHRVTDLIRAEEFAQRAGDRQANPGSKLHNYLLACQLVSLNGRPFTGTLEALAWVSAQPSPVLNALRDDISMRDFGYDVTPRFRCPHCGGSFRMRLPLDGSIFRRRRRR